MSIMCITSMNSDTSLYVLKTVLVEIKNNKVSFSCFKEHLSMMSDTMHIKENKNTSIHPKTV